MEIEQELKRTNEMLFLHLYTRVKNNSLFAISSVQHDIYGTKQLTQLVSTRWGVAVVDVNNDSKPDIIVANYDSNNVGVFLNTGNGTFIAQTTYSTSSNPLGVAVVDINSDNKPDIHCYKYG